MDRRDRVDQCKVILYKFQNVVTSGSSAFSGAFSQALTGLGIGGGVGGLEKAEAFDISNHIMNVSFSKNLGQGAGSFSIVLGNSLDWSRFLKPGEWLTIYMTGEGDLLLPSESAKTNPKNLLSNPQNVVSALTTKADMPNLPGVDASQVKSWKKRLRAICQVQRVATRASIDINGSTDISFVVSGKDLGVCLEETELFLHFMLTPQKAAENFAAATNSNQARNLTFQMSKWFDAFFKPDAIYGKDAPYITELKQWVLPDKMLEHLDISVDGDPYFGHIKGLKDFHPTYFENNLPNPFSGLQGIAWGKLKQFSQSEYHEFFLELDDEGSPRLTFRPIPWALDKSEYPNIGQYVTLYKDLAKLDTSLASGINGAVSNLKQALPSRLTSLVGQNIQPTSILNSRMDLPSVELIDYDVGPDYHSIYNYYFIDSSASKQPGSSAMSIFLKEKLEPYPYRNIASIKRYGFKPLITQTSSYRTQAADFSNNPGEEKVDAQFLREATKVLQDYWRSASNFYSGTLTIVGKNETKIGKAIVTDGNALGMANMVFYLEGYTDSFTIDGETGVCEWTQSLMVTRGMEVADLVSGREGDLEQKSAFEKLGDFTENTKK